MNTNSFLFRISKKLHFFRKIYIYYNIYIRNIKFFFKSSQFNEDIKILKKLPNFFKESGFYVDVGCFHPIRYNNTYKMFKKGWKGMNIDLNPFSVELFNVARPNDINICTAVSNKKFRNLYFDHILSANNTLEKNQTIFYKKIFHFNTKKPKKIKTKTLSEIFKKNKIYKVDFLNIDAEGHELDILKSINFKEFDIRVMCIEIIRHNKKSIKKSKKTIKYLQSNNFKFRFKESINFIFTR